MKTLMSVICRLAICSRRGHETVLDIMGEADIAYCQRCGARTVLFDRYA